MGGVWWLQLGCQGIGRGTTEKGSVGTPNPGIPLTRKSEEKQSRSKCFHNRKMAKYRYKVRNAMPKNVGTMARTVSSYPEKVDKMY